MARDIPTPDLVDLQRLRAWTNADQLLLVERIADEAWVIDLTSGDFIQLGRKGEGPGEYRGPIDGGWTGDSIWIADSQLRRIVVFGPNGEHVRTVAPGAFSGADPSARPTGLLSGGTYFLRSTRGTMEVIRGDGVDTHLTWLAPTGELLRTLTLPTRNAELVAQTPRGDAYHTTQPFAQFDQFAVDPKGSGVWVAGTSENHIALRRFDSEGQEVYSRTIRYDAPELRRAEIEDWISGVFERNPTLGRQFERPLREAIERPETWPLFDRITAGSDGSLWLRHPHASGDRWRRVCEKGGEYVLRFPEDVISVFSGGGRVLGIRRGPFDVPEIVEFTLPKGLPLCEIAQKG